MQHVCFNVAFPMDVRVDLRRTAVVADRRQRAGKDVAAAAADADASRTGIRYGIDAGGLGALIVLARNGGAEVLLRTVIRILEQRMRFGNGRHTDVFEHGYLRIIRINRTLGRRGGCVLFIITAALVPVPVVGGGIGARGFAVAAQSLIDVALRIIRHSFRRRLTEHRTDPLDVMIVRFITQGVLVAHVNRKSGVVVQRTNLRPRIGHVVFAGDRIGQRPFDHCRTVRRGRRLDRAALNRPGRLAGRRLASRRHLHAGIAARERDVFHLGGIRRRNRRLNLTFSAHFVTALINVRTVRDQIRRYRKNHRRAEYSRRYTRHRRRSAADHGERNRHRGEDHHDHQQRAERTLECCHT